MQASVAGIRVSDDIGNDILLSKPAKRVISLAPHLTELLFDAGATNQVIGAVSYSDYPDAAKNIPRVGRNDRFDLEIITAMKPDLIVAWETGNTLNRIEEIRGLGIPVYVNEPREFSDIAATLLTLGKLLGTEMVAQQKAHEFEQAITLLAKENAAKSTVQVFYQVWDKPVFTVNGDHLISKVIQLCGGENVFAKVPALSPQVGIEAILARDPQVIIAGTNQERTHWLDDWKQWRGLRAVQQDQLYEINADLIVRHTPRILEGARRMCDILEQVRSSMPAR